MKKYIFMVPTIINMGGTQMYIRNKTIWLRKQGWEVQIISVHKGDVIIPELREFDTFINEMQFPIYLFSESIQKKVIARIIDKIQSKNYLEIIIESTCIGVTTWAESIAKIIGAKHLVYLLQEMNQVDNVMLQKYFIFKHVRRELVSITEQSLKMMFENFSPINIEKSYHLNAYCNNVVDDIDSSFIHSISWDKFDYKIGCLSRIDKPYISTAIANFANFAKVHYDKSFLLFMIGGAPNIRQYTENIRYFFRETKNVDIVISGYMFPISTKLLESFDAFFSSAGSCYVCMRSGVPTIAIDCNDFMPIGIMRHTTLNPLYRGEDEPILNYQDIFEDVIIKNKYKKFTPEHKIYEPNFTEHMDFLNKTEKKLVYYDMNINELTLSEKRIKIALFFIGASNYIKLSRLKRKLIRKNTNDR